MVSPGSGAGTGQVTPSRREMQSSIKQRQCAQPWEWTGNYRIRLLMANFLMCELCLSTGEQCVEKCMFWEDKSRAPDVATGEWNTISSLPGPPLQSGHSRGSPAVISASRGSGGGLRGVRTAVPSRRR